MQGDGIPPRTAARLMMSTEPGNPVCVGIACLTTALCARVVSQLGSESAQALWPAGLTYRTQGTDMAFAAFLTTGCGAFLAACLRYLSDGPIMRAATAGSTRFYALSPEMRLSATTGLRRGLITSSVSFAKTTTPPRRERGLTLGIVGNG